MPTVHLARHDDAVGRAFTIVSGEYPSSLEVAEALADEFDMKVEPADIPSAGSPTRSGERSGTGCWPRA
jgi:nucleoside-diphosphate-sugar epimerase